MQPKTEEFLGMLLWTLDTALRPTFRNLDQSYEGWAYRNGFLRQVDTLADRGLIERRSGGSPDARIYRLSEQGRLHVLGGRDPEREWNRRWDGRWRVVLLWGHTNPQKFLAVSMQKNLTTDGTDGTDHREM